MNTSTLKATLLNHPNSNVEFVLPNGKLVPIHAHLTEVGRVDKTFMDCGATIRKTSYLCLQSWVADDISHRLAAVKLANIIDRAAPIIGEEDLEVELEHEDEIISQFPIESQKNEGNTLRFQLGRKHTDCLAKAICLPTATVEDNPCCSDSGCC